MTPIDRRSVLRGGGVATAGLGLGGSAPVEPPSCGEQPVVATVPELARTAAPPGTIVYLADAGRAGLFVAVAGPPPADDPQQGLFVRSARGHFARLWDGRAGQPEWFGARLNDGAADCAPAIEACVALCPITVLAQADYFIRRTLVLGRSWRTVRGSGGYAADQGQGTRIILQGSAASVHTADVVLVGSRAMPGRTSESFATEVHLSDLTLIRDAASAPHSSGDPRRYPAGLRASFLTRCTFRNIASLDSALGFYFGGLVYTKVDDCLAQRLRAGEGPGRDLAIGYFLDGSPEFGMAGGNASLYLDRCLAVGQHPRHVQPTGLVAAGAFVDSFIDRFESARIDYGMRFAAAGASGAGQTVDLHVRNAVLDGCGGTGIDLDLTGTQTASIEIIDPYIYAAGDGGTAGLAVRDGGGLVTITGGQIHGDFRSGSLLIERTRGIRVQGLKLHEGRCPVVVAASGALHLEPQVSNQSRRTSAFAVECGGVYRAAIRPLVIGAPGTFAGGVSLDVRCNFSSVDTSAVDPGCFREVTRGRKLWFGGRDATAEPGATAFAAAGNVVTGVTG